MKKLIRILAVVFCLIVITGCFTGCKNNELDNEPDNEPQQVKNFAFNARYMGGTLKKSYLFKEENRLWFRYPKKDYYPDDINNNKPYIEGIGMPSTRVIFIKDQITFEEAFENDDRVIDFETKMVMIILFTEIGSFRWWTEDIKFENEVLEVVIGDETWGPLTAPRLIYSVYLMDKAEINNTKVTFV